MWFGPHDSFIWPITNSTSDSLGLIIETTNTTTTFTASLKFLPLQSKHNGTYTCKVNFQGKSETSHKIVNVKGIITFIFIILNNFHKSKIICAVPDIEVVILSDISPGLGETYNLTCNVNGAGNLNATTTYHWTKDNGTNTLLKTNTTNYSFPTFRLSDAGNYTCEVNVNSTYLDDTINEHNYTQLEISSKCFFTMSK